VGFFFVQTKGNILIDITTIGIGVQTDKLKSGTQELNRFGQSADNASKKADGLSSSSQKLEKQSSGAALGLRRMAAGLAAVVGAGSITRTIDEYTKFTAQLKLATRSQEEYAKAFSDVQRIASTAQSSISSISVLYARLNNALRELGINQDQVGKITENVGLALKITGATATETSSAMLQLSQAFGSGVLRGEELNAVYESAPALMRALADSIGVPIGALRQLASDGKLTSDVLAKAFGDQALLDKFREQAKEVNTISGAFQVLKNRLMLLTGEMNAATSAGSSFANIMLSLANSDAIRIPFEAISVFAVNVAYVFKQVGTEIGGVAAQIAALMRFDFEAVGQIRKMMVADAKAARIEVDRVTQAILNPKKTNNETMADEIRKVTAETLNATAATRDLNKERKLIDQEDKKQQISDALLAQQREYEGETAKFYNMLAKIKKDDDKEESARKLKNIDLWEKATEERYKLEQDEIKKIAREQEDMARDINRSLTDALFRGFEKGKSFFNNFKDTLLNAFQTMILRPRIEAIITSTGIGGLLSSNANASGGILDSVLGGESTASGGGMGGLGDLFSMGKSLFGNGGFQGALVGSIENLGTIFSNGMGGLGDSIGGFLGANAGMIADVLPFAGAALQLLQGNTKGAAFTAIGAAVGSMIPIIGTALGGLIGSFVGSLFGGKDYKRFGTTVSGYQAAGGEYQKTGEGKIYDRKIAGISTPLNDLNKAFAGTLTTLFDAFDIESNIGMTSGMFQRGKSKKSGGVFNATIDGVNTGQMKVQLKKASMEQVYNALVDMVMGEGLVRAIQSSRLSADIKSLFDGFTDKTQVTALIQATMNLNGAQAELASRFGITVDQSAQAAKSTGLVGQALIDYVNKLTASAMAFATVGDQLIKFRTSLEDVYGGGLPDTLKAYDAALKGIDKTTQEGIDTFVELFGIRDQFVQFRQAIDGLKGNVRGALFGMVSDAEKQQMLNEDLAKLFGDLVRDVPGSIQELIALGKSIDYTTAEGLNLAAVFPTLVNAFNQTQAAVDSLVNSLRDANNFKTLIDYQRYTGVARNYGNTFANNYADTMPSYDVGTSYVPNDGVAMLHQGEAVLTRGENASLRESNAQLVSEIRTLNAKVDRLVYSMDKTATNTKRTADIMTNITPNGDAIQTEAVA
jgi:tape measure domain-containing protein